VRQTLPITLAPLLSRHCPFIGLAAGLCYVAYFEWGASDALLMVLKLTLGASHRKKQECSSALGQDTGNWNWGMRQWLSVSWALVVMKWSSRSKEEVGEGNSLKTPVVSPWAPFFSLFWFENLAIFHASRDEDASLPLKHSKATRELRILFRGVSLMKPANCWPIRGTTYAEIRSEPGNSILNQRIDDAECLAMMVLQLSMD